MAKQNIDESKVVGANYVASFYNNIQQLNNYYALYINTLATLKQKIKPNSDVLSTLPEAEKAELINSLQYFRYAATQTYTGYLAINLNLSERQIINNEEGKPINIAALYNSIKDNYVINQDVAEQYVIYMNIFLMKDIIKSLLETGAQLISSLYTDDK